MTMGVGRHELLAGGGDADDLELGGDDDEKRVMLLARFEEHLAALHGSRAPVGGDARDLFRSPIGRFCPSADPCHRLQDVGPLDRPIGVVERREMDSMPCSNRLHLLDPPRSDEPSPLREGFEPALQRERDAFEQTSMDHVGERMPIQNSVKIGRERHSAGDLSQTSEEDSSVWHLSAWRQVLRVARVANDCMGRDPAQQKRGRRQARGADDDVGFRGESPEIGRDLHLSSIGLQL